MWIGTAFALAAGLAYGLVFVAPVLLPQYPALLLSCARYLAFGLIALPLALMDRRQLAGLARADWIEALKLSMVGNLLYYACLAAAIQRAGAPLATMIIGALPVAIAIAANRRRSAVVLARDGRLPWRRLLPSLMLIGAGIALVNHDEWARLDADADPMRYLGGALLAMGAVACWTWYPIRNADWLRAHPGRHPRVWATAQGLATLPLAVVGYALYIAWAGGSGRDFPLPLGPDPARFVGLMFTIALVASWLGTTCWNEASQRLPPALGGQLIVFETLAALAYAFALRAQWPGAATAVGIGLLLAGVVWALRTRPVAAVAVAAH
jgi:drug/metabolite transporter (DMT)-like permease